jgi:hypothetical protein
MASYGDQIAAARSAHTAVSQLDAIVRTQMSSAFDGWLNNQITDSDILTQLENIVHSAFASGSAVAASLVSNQSGIVGWQPETILTTSSYLDQLIADVQSNWKIYLASGQEQADQRNLLMRIQHSAGVGAQEGYTEEIISGYTELQDFGYEVQKVWAANFVNHIPCVFCRQRNGQVIGLKDDFARDGEKLYHGDTLQGPPGHPHCECVAIVLITTLENAFDKIDVDDPNPEATPSAMTPDDVKKIPSKIFNALLKSLQVLKRLFGKKPTSGSK